MVTFVNKKKTITFSLFVILKHLNCHVFNVGMEIKIRNVISIKIIGIITKNAYIWMETVVTTDFLPFGRKFIFLHVKFQTSKAGDIVSNIVLFACHSDESTTSDSHKYPEVTRAKLEFFGRYSEI